MSISILNSLISVQDKQPLNEFFKPIVDFLEKIIFFDLGRLFNSPLDAEVPFIVVWLIIGGVLFTISFKFINIRGFKHAWDIVLGKCKKGDAGEVSHFQALTTALSATVGLGNIAGVAIAVSTGGPGATFWMIIAGFLGMSMKFAECTLGMKFRKINPDGSISGGPMYYLSEGLKSKRLARLGSVLAVIYAVFIILASFGGGNMFQSNQAYGQLTVVLPYFDDKAFLVGILIAALVGLVILGGIQSIAKVTSRIVPIMAGVYILAALIIISVHFKDMPAVLKLIVQSAFSGDAIKGGVIGVLITGFRRGAFSNEAGIGSASIAHSAAKTKIPIREGYVALLEPFIDTIVICTMTALVIIFTGVYQDAEGIKGVALTSKAFSQIFSWFPVVLVIAVFLFAYSTMISWSYYGQKGFSFLFQKFLGMKMSKYIYQVIFLLFIVLGTTTDLNEVIDFSDMMILALAFPNLIGMYILIPEILNEIKVYRQKKT